MKAADFIVRNIGVLATLEGPAPRKGPAMRDLGLIPHAAVAAAGGRIVYAGPEEGLADAVSAAAGASVLDAAGAAALPGFVDSHTHLAFAGDRDDEIRRRLAGASYQEIAAAGGGIVRSVAATRAATLDELVRNIEERLDEMLLCGTTTAEIKSGYGLETSAELKSLQAIREAGQTHSVTVVPTFLGAHEVPLEHRGGRERYLRMVMDEMIPEVARQELAVFCDVFCEAGVFSVPESRLILTAGRKHGLTPRIHADELQWTGGAELAAELHARSADHLLFVSEDGIQALAEAGCMATLLPAAAFYLRLGGFAPARTLIEARVSVALATDVNPGGGLSPSLPFVMAVACFQMGLCLEEAITAVTLNAACSLDLQGEVGSLQAGRRADLIVLRSARLLDLVRIGVPAIRAVVKNGRIVVQDGRLV